MLVSDLRKIGIQVRRYKIESALIDSNVYDEMGLLGC